MAAGATVVAIAVDWAFVEHGRIAVGRYESTIVAAADRHGVPPMMVAASTACQGDSLWRPFGLDAVEKAHMWAYLSHMLGNEPSVGIGQIMPTQARELGVTEDPWALSRHDVSIECMAAMLSQVDARIADLAENGYAVGERDRWMAMVIQQNGGSMLEIHYEKYGGKWEDHLSAPGDARTRDVLLPGLWEQIQWLKQQGWEIPPDVEASIQAILEQYQ